MRGVLSRLQKSSLLLGCWNRRQQGARFSNDAVLELRVLNQRGAEQRATGFVVVDAGLTGCTRQNLGLQARGSLRSAPIFDVGSDQRKQVVRQEAEEGV